MRRTILLADDSPTIRRLVTQTFADGNFEIVEVSNGEAAIKALEEVKPSVVLADIYMPGKNGYEVCAYVRNHPKLHATPVVLLVGAFDAFDEDTARQAGATANITKPFEPGALIELVKSILPPLTEEPRRPDPYPEPEREPKPTPQQKPEPEPVVRKMDAVPSPPTPPPKPPPSAAPAAAPPAGSEEIDLLGLEMIFKDEPPLIVTTQAGSGSLTEADIDRIADRVIQRISTQVIESIAWDVVPDITEKIVREELKRIDES
jgi:CheY-like chemotaxis protein